MCIQVYLRGYTTGRGVQPVLNNDERYVLVIGSFCSLVSFREIKCRLCRRVSAYGSFLDGCYDGICEAMQVLFCHGKTFIGAPKCSLGAPKSVQVLVE